MIALHIHYRECIILRTKTFNALSKRIRMTKAGRLDLRRLRKMENVEHIHSSPQWFGIAKSLIILDQKKKLHINSTL